MPSQSRLNWVALVILVLATGFEHYWVWGLLFMFWAASAITGSRSVLLLPIDRQAEPLLYWATNSMWLVFGLWYFIFDVLWRFGIYTILDYNLYPSGS